MNRMEYHADPAVGSSALACALRSAREYEAQFVSRTLSVTETDAMRFGTLVHLRILEPHKYAERVVRIPPDVLSKSGSRAGSAWKEWQSQQQASGNVIVTDAEHDRIQGIAESIERTPIARYVIESIEYAEQPLRWTCERTGVQCKGMIDAALSSGVLCDIKTTTDVAGKVLGARSSAACTTSRRHITWTATARLAAGGGWRVRRVRRIWSASTRLPTTCWSVGRRCGWWGWKGSNAASSPATGQTVRSAR
jgi:hypothetical protein